MSDKLRDALANDVANATYIILHTADGSKRLSSEGHAALVAALAQPQNDADAVASVVPCYTPSGKRVALYSDHQNLPIGTKLYTAPPSHERMRELLNGRDNFIVSKGLWSEFVDTLPRTGDLCQQCQKRKADRIFLDDTHTFHTCGDCWSTNHHERDNHASVGKCQTCKGTGENLANPMNAGQCDDCKGTGSHASDGKESEGLDPSSLPSGESDLPVTAGSRPSDPTPPDREAIEREDR